MDNPYLQMLVDQRYGQGWGVAWELPGDGQILDIPAHTLEQRPMESHNLIHCLVALKTTSPDLLGNDEPSAQVLSLHVSEDNARRMLARLESIADPQIKLSIQSLPLEQ